MQLYREDITHEKVYKYDTPEEKAEHADAMAEEGFFAVLDEHLPLFMRKHNNYGVYRKVLEYNDATE